MAVRKLFSQNKYCVYSAWLFYSLACQPRGEYPRQIHPQSQAFLAKPIPSTHPASNFPSSSQAGLPPNCQIDFSQAALLCISCKSPDGNVERCYAYNGQFQALSSCAYTSERLKCLQVNPPFAMNLNLRVTLEKLTLEQINTWEESLRSIALSQLPKAQHIEFQHALAFTQQLAKEIMLLHGHEPWTHAEELSRIAHVQSSPSHRQELIIIVEKLRNARLSGQLKLSQILQSSQSWLHTVGVDESILKYWGALSLDGLEDDN